MSSRRVVLFERPNLALLVQLSVRLNLPHTQEPVIRLMVNCMGIGLTVTPAYHMLIIVHHVLRRPIINQYRHNVTYVQSDSDMYKPLQIILFLFSFFFLLSSCLMVILVQNYDGTILLIGICTCIHTYIHTYIHTHALIYIYIYIYIYRRIFKRQLLLHFACHEHYLNLFVGCLGDVSLEHANKGLTHSLTHSLTDSLC